MARELFLVAALAMLMAVIDANGMQFTGRWNMQSKNAFTPQNTRKSSSFRQLTSNSKSTKIVYGVPVSMSRHSVKMGQQPPNRHYTSNVKFGGSRAPRPPTTSKPFYKSVYNTGQATFRLSSYPRQAAVTLTVVRPTAHTKQAPSYVKFGFNARLHATKPNARGANAPKPMPKQFSFSQGYVQKSPGPRAQAPPPRPPPRHPQPNPIRYQPPPRYNPPPPPRHNPQPPPRRVPPRPPRHNPPPPPPRQPQYPHPPPHPAPPRYNYMPPAPPQYHPRPHPPRPHPHYYHPPPPPPPPPPRYNLPYVFPTKKPVTPAPTPKPTTRPTTTTTTTTKKPIPETEVEVENGARPTAQAQPLPQCDYWYIDPQGVYKWFPCQKQTFAPPPPTTTPMPLDLIFYDIQTVPPPEPVYIPIYYDYPDRKKEEESTK